MPLDPLTLTVAGAFVALLSSLVLGGAALQISRAPALLWWAVATLIGAAGICLLAYGRVLDSFAIIMVGVALMTVGPPLIWGGIRVFGGRTTPLPLLAAGCLAWILVNLIPLPGGRMFATAFSFVPLIAYLSAAVYELWRGRDEVLPARWPLAAMFVIHSLIFLGGIFDTLTGRFSDATLPAIDSWFGLIAFESLLYSMGSAVFMVLLAKERNEREVILASRKDYLTGVANRGALLEGGERLLRRCQQDGKSFSLAMFDLDRFKRVNDSFGHTVGDEVLRRFAEVARSILRPNDLFGRYGGEEFIVVLPGATIEAAYVVADRIRNAFAASPVMAGDTTVRTTVSGGVANADSVAQTLEAIIVAADACLYRAKGLGRNRIERPAKVFDEPARSNVIRVA